MQPNTDAAIIGAGCNMAKVERLDPYLKAYEVSGGYDFVFR